MRPEPKLSPDAQADVAHAVQRLNHGYDFLDEVERITSLIRESPFLFTLVDPPIRRALLRRFPYGAFYVPGTGDEPDIIVAVIDLRQDPDVIRRAYQR